MNYTAENWRLGAACKGMSDAVDWWFPEQGQTRTDEIKRAIAICSSCPVQLPCLLWSMEEEEMGIWGGLNTYRREKIAGKRFSNTAASPRELGMLLMESWCPCGARIVEGRGHICSTTAQRGMCIECDRYTTALSGDQLCATCHKRLSAVIAEDLKEVAA